MVSKFKQYNGVATWTSVAGLSEVDEAERADDNEEWDNA